MTRPAAPATLLAALLGAACGVVGGVAGGWLVSRDAGRGRGADGTIRGDLDRVEAESLTARVEHAAAIAAIARRVDELAQRAEAAGAGGAEETGRALRAVTEDLRALRDAATRDLRAADARLAELEHRVDELVALAALMPPPAATSGRPTEEEEAVWVNLARDSDPLRRFSALAMLGRTSTDRSVRASREALRDPAEIVVWQAARNLGQFEEHGAARDLAALLRHEGVAVRNAAWEALRRLGAPDVRFDATALAEARRAATEALERWAVEQQ